MDAGTDADAGASTGYVGGGESPRNDGADAEAAAAAVEAATAEWVERKTAALAELKKLKNARNAAAAEAAAAAAASAAADEKLKNKIEEVSWSCCRAQPLLLLLLMLCE